jgi:acyl-CoA synthetase (AMP-forming)/AMP-acid ligase II
MTQALHRAVQQTPDLPATVFGERVHTWAEQRRPAARLAGALHGLGVVRGDRVALWRRTATPTTTSSSPCPGPMRRGAG